MTESTTYWVRRLTSVRSHQTGHRAMNAVPALVLRLGAAALEVWIGYIHLHLWLEGYRQIPTDGPFFLLDAVAAFVLAGALLVWPRPLVGLLAAGCTASTLGALVISLSVGLFGFTESITASFVVESLVIETMAVLALLGWCILVTGRLRGADSHVKPGR